MNKDKKPRRLRKSSFYHLRWHKVGLNEERAAEILGVTVEDVRKFDTEGAPVMAERLLELWDRKHVRIEGWDGFMFSRGVLIHKRKRWRPETLLANKDHAEENQALKHEIKRLYSWKGLARILKTVVRHAVPHVSRGTKTELR